jgi:RNA polymerase sigma-70 factor (ECF subfamily)
LLQAIDRLPEEEREVFDLIRIQGLTYAEVAQLLGVSGTTIKRRLSRSRLRLAEQLADLRPTPSQRSGVRGQESGDIESADLTPDP